ncbi:MAG: hypothetical protein SGI92_31710 [Bryobacteraceae bacterium]|nr:hypothetical protein [Bryobacteraceae bacterium]
MRSPKQLLLLAVAVLLIGRYYYWQSRITGGRFEENRDLNGYYDLLGRALASGHTYLPIDPAPEMMRLQNPWDPQQNLQWRMHDSVLFNGRYYLYHGVVPAVLLFAPWRILTGYDLPQHFGLFLILCAGFLFWVGAVVRVRGPGWTSVLAAVAFGLCCATPYLLNRIDVYEIAIGGGFLCVGAGMFFLAGRQYGLAGFCFGLAVGCRPHLGLVGSFGFVLLIVQRRSRAELLRFALPMAVCIAALGAYNFARFGNPLEFGMRYMLAGDLRHQKLNLSVSNLLPGLYYYIWSPPELQPVFPWIRTVMRLPSQLVFPPGYFLEGTVGLLFFAPACLLAFRATSGLARMTALAGFALLVFHIGTGFTTQRYFPDFAPLLIFTVAVSCTGRIMHAVFAVAVIWGASVNMMAALAGPWQDYLKKRPDSYLRLARTFSPTAHVRPVKDPPLDITLEATPEPLPDGLKHPLLSLGRDAYRYLLYVEHKDHKVSVISKTDESAVPCASGLPESVSLRVHMVYDTTAQTMRISVNGGPPVEHKTGLLITAPAQVQIGATDRFYYEVSVPAFVGKIAQMPR